MEIKSRPGSPTPSSTPQAAEGSSRFRIVANTQEEEDQYDYVAERKNPKTTGFPYNVFIRLQAYTMITVLILNHFNVELTINTTRVLASVAHLVKGALGGGILASHVGFMKGGLVFSSVTIVLVGVYVAFCLHLLVKAAQILYRRMRIHTMSYADVGEAAMICFPNPKVTRFSKPFRYTVDVVICMDLFGACATYQLIIAKSLKQLVENSQTTSLDGKEPGYPGLRVYMAAMCIPIILICLIRHLKYLAPFSVGANIIIMICACTAVYYVFEFNPKFENLVLYTSPYKMCEFIGMAAFSMSCAGVVLPIENSMREPKKFPLTLTLGMCINVVLVFTISFFGYASFLDKCESPITVNFPMRMFPRIIKGGIAIMIYATHALNFWVPFNLVFHYIKKRHNEKNIVKWELFYRTIFVITITIVAITFPNINSLMGFLGSFCLSLMAFVWPNIIYLLVIWKRPGLGKFRWKLWRSLVLIIIGMVLFVCGSGVNLIELMKNI